MKSHCLKCRKDTEYINPRISKTSNSILKMCNMWKKKNQNLLKIKKQKDY